MYGSEVVSVSIYDKNGYFKEIDDMLIKVLQVSTLTHITDIENLKKIYKYNTKFFILKHFSSKSNNYLLLIDVIDELLLKNITSSPLPILWIQSDGVILHSNTSALDKLGYDDLSNYKIYRLSSDSYQEDWQKLWNIVINKNIEVRYNYYNKQKDKLMYVNLSCNYIESYDVCQMIITDLTPLVLVNDNLIKKKQLDDDTEKLINSFLSNISHEIRTPMNAIIGYSSILSDYVDQSLKKYTDILIQNTERLLVLMENIISMSKIDSGNIVIYNGVFNIQDIFKNMLSIYSNKIITSYKDITLIIDTKDRCVINTDKYMFEECIHKLLDNAVKFTETGEIHIGYELIDNHIRVYVNDTGIGIDLKKYESKIFNRFFKIDRWTVGMGLGLAIFKAYMDIMGGEYHIKSNIDHGSEFSFKIKI